MSCRLDHSQWLIATLVAVSSSQRERTSTMATKAPSSKTVLAVRAALSDSPVSAASIAKATNLSADTVRRALVTIQADGNAIKDEASGGWVRSAADTTPLQDVAKAVVKAIDESPVPARKAAKAAAKDKPKGKPSVTRKDAKLPEDDGAVPGYFLRWPHTGFNHYKRNADGSVESPLWTVRCNEHGETTTTNEIKEADRLGRRADRAVWCKGCKAKARKAAKEAEKA